MKGNFAACLAFDERKDIEGGNDDDPQDHGGRTSRGITQTEYNAWQFLHKGPEGDVWKAPQETIDAIYEHSYWQPYCDMLPPGVDLMYFDTAVNEGARKAVLFLQRGLEINDDGHFGIVTAASVRKVGQDPAFAKVLIRKIADERRADYRRNRQFRRYGKGWLARVGKCETAALSMVA